MVVFMETVFAFTVVCSVTGVSIPMVAALQGIRRMLSRAGVAFSLLRRPSAWLNQACRN